MAPCQSCFLSCHFLCRQRGYYGADEDGRLFPIGKREPPILRLDEHAIANQFDFDFALVCLRLLSRACHCSQPFESPALSGDSMPVRLEIGTENQEQFSVMLSTFVDGSDESIRDDVSLFA